MLSPWLPAHYLAGFLYEFIEEINKSIKGIYLLNILGNTAKSTREKV